MIEWVLGGGCLVATDLRSISSIEISNLGRGLIVNVTKKKIREPGGETIFHYYGFLFLISVSVDFGRNVFEQCMEINVPIME